MLLKTPGHGQVALLPRVSGGVMGGSEQKHMVQQNPWINDQAGGQRESKNQGSGFPFKGMYPVTQRSSVGQQALKVYSTSPSQQHL